MVDNHSECVHNSSRLYMWYMFPATERVRVCALLFIPTFLGIIPFSRIGWIYRLINSTAVIISYRMIFTLNLILCYVRLCEVNRQHKRHTHIIRIHISVLKCIRMYPHSYLYILHMNILYSCGRNYDGNLGQSAQIRRQWIGEGRMEIWIKPCVWSDATQALVLLNCKFIHNPAHPHM